MRQAFLASEQSMAETVKLRVTLLEQQQNREAESTERTLGEIDQQNKRNLAFLTEQQQMLAKAMEQASLTSMTGSQASLTQTNKLLASAVSMLGTKDTLAYTQVMGPAMPQDSSSESYTAIDEVAEEEARRLYFQEQETLERAQSILEGLGVKTDGPASFAGPAQTA